LDWDGVKERSIPLQTSVEEAVLGGYIGEGMEIKSYWIAIPEISSGKRRRVGYHGAVGGKGWRK